MENNKDEKKINDLIGKKTVPGKSSNGRLNPFIALILGLFAGAILTAFIIFSFQTQDVVPVSNGTTTSGGEVIFSDELVYITPTIGCTDLCENLSVSVSNFATEAGLKYRNVKLEANISVPGIFLMGNDYITDIVPFDTVEALPAIFCNEFEYEQYCQ